MRMKVDPVGLGMETREVPLRSMNSTGKPYAPLIVHPLPSIRV